jgi:hypothetical protein
MYVPLPEHTPPARRSPAPCCCSRPPQAPPTSGQLESGGGAVCHGVGASHSCSILPLAASRSTHVPEPRSRYGSEGPASASSGPPGTVLARLLSELVRLGAWWTLTSLSLSRAAARAPLTTREGRLAAVKDDDTLGRGV